MRKSVEIGYWNLSDYSNFEEVSDLTANLKRKIIPFNYPHTYIIRIYFFAKFSESEKKGREGFHFSNPDQKRPLPSTSTLTFIEGKIEF